MIRHRTGFINPDHITHVHVREDKVCVHLDTKVDHVELEGEEAANLVEFLDDGSRDIRVKTPEPEPEPAPDEPASTTGY